MTIIVVFDQRGNSARFVTEGEALPTMAQIEIGIKQIVLWSGITPSRVEDAEGAVLWPVLIPAPMGLA